jgi:acyl-CoA dehydrogenase
VNAAPGDLELLTGAARDLFRRACTPEVVAEAEREGWAPRLWRALEESGLAHVGFEASREEALAVVRVAAEFAAPVPLAETVLAALVEPGLEARGALTVAAGGRAPYGRFAVHIVGAGAFALTPDVNLAGEPRDRVSPAGLDAMLPLGALVRSVQMAGALQTVLELTVEHAGQRQQFGSPLNRFQAVQQHLAALAAEVAAAGAAADSAVSEPDELHVAVAKVRCGEAAGAAAALAHQVHGAIGFTDEHRLQQYTRRLWSWRDDFGTEAQWAVRLGRLAVRLGTDGVWEKTL